MTPEAALEAQIDRYRQMTGEERLLIGLRMHEESCEIGRENIRSQFPNAGKEEVEEKLRERIRLAHGLDDDRADILLREGKLEPKTT